MDSIEVGWRKHSPDKVQFLSNKQRFQQHSIQKSEKQSGESNKKKVQFDLHSSSFEQQAFENTEYNHFGTVRSQKAAFEDYDSSSSTINIVPKKVPTIDNNPICSVRATAITFIIVVFIILAVAIAVGIVFGTIKPQKSSLATVTGNNNLNPLSTISTTVVVSSISIGSQSGAPCTSYTTINDPTRNVANTAIYGTCDRGPLFNESNGGSWIRFVGTGGTTIPLTAPGIYHCGGFGSGWFNGTLPTTVGTAVNGTVCFDINSYSCWSFVNVSVINCGGFYVHFLPPVTVCNSRYCTT